MDNTATEGIRKLMQQ